MVFDQAIQATQDLVMEDCLICGIVFMVPAIFRRHRKEKGDSFYCPNGHSLIYHKSEVQLLQEQIADLTKKNAEVTAKFWAEQSKVRKLAERISKGICPCCRRSFVNLQRHMKTKHPDFENKRS